MNHFVTEKRSLPGRLRRLEVVETDHGEYVGVRGIGLVLGHGVASSGPSTAAFAWTRSTRHTTRVVVRRPARKMSVTGRTRARAQAHRMRSHDGAGHVRRGRGDAGRRSLDRFSARALHISRFGPLLGGAGATAAGTIISLLAQGRTPAVGRAAAGPRPGHRRAAACARRTARTVTVRVLVAGAPPAAAVNVTRTRSRSLR